MAEHQVRIKRVTVDDYAKVMDMFPPGEIYCGIDYLPDYFYMLMDMFPPGEIYCGIDYLPDYFYMLMDMFPPGEIYCSIDYLPDYFYMLMDMFPPGEIYCGIDYLPDYFHMLMDMFPPGEIYCGIDYLPDYFYMLMDMFPPGEIYCGIDYLPDYFHMLMDMFPPGEIYCGIDYLPDYFYMLMDMSNVEAYAAVKDNKFVSFILFSIVDDGRTLVSRAARTKKGYERQGLNSSIMKFFHTVSLKEKSLEHYASFAGIHVKDIYKKLETGERYKVLQRDFRCFVGSSSKDLYEKLNRQAKIKSSPRLINEAELRELLSNKKICDTFFPEGRVTIDGIPYKTIKSNAALIMTEKTSIVMSGSHEFDNGLLTSVNCFRAHLGLTCNFDVFGFINLTLLEHLLLHLKNTLLVNNNENVIIGCLCAENTNWNVVSFLMSELGLEEQMSWGTGIICTEQRKQCFESNV